MLLTFRDLPRLKVFTQDEPNTPCASVVDCVVERDTGKIEAFWVSVKGKTLLLPKSRISYWKDASFFVDQVENLLPAPIEKHLKKVIEQEVSIYKAAVWEEGTFIGNVKNFSFDTISPRIVYLHVTKGFWMFKKHLIIHSGRIEKVDTKGIHIFNKPIKNTVSAGEALETEKKLAEVSSYESFSKSKK